MATTAGTLASIGPNGGTSSADADQVAGYATSAEGMTTSA